MKILLLGEYSNLHWTLAQGLRCFGCDVTVASSGDKFKNYDRDINLVRDGYDTLGSLKYIYQVGKHFLSFKGFDVVQIINPFFLDLKADINLYAFNYLKKHNGKVFMGAFGNDAYWLKACISKNIFRYSEFDIPGKTRYSESALNLINIWSDKDKVRINTEIATRSDGIIACLYEYYAAYKTDFSEKLAYVPAPINTKELRYRRRGLDRDKIIFFVGIQKLRSKFKGTDVLYKVLQEIHHKYPKESEIITAESVPYSTYMNMTSDSDVLLDQLYSYSPAMNGLMAMAQGLVVVGGGEPEIYDLLQPESENRPIVNVLPTEGDVYDKLEYLINNKNIISKLSSESRAFVDKYHNYSKIATIYLKIWRKL